MRPSVVERIAAGDMGPLTDAEWHEVKHGPPDTRDTAARWAAPWWAFARCLVRGLVWMECIR